MYAPRGGARSAPDAAAGGSGGAGGPGEGGLLAGSARRASWETSDQNVATLENLVRSRRGSGSSSGHGPPSGAGAAAATAGLPPAAPRPPQQWTLLPAGAPAGAPLPPAPPTLLLPPAAAPLAGSPPPGDVGAGAGAGLAGAAAAGGAPPGWQESYAISSVLVAHVVNLKRATRKLDPEDELMAYHRVTAALDRVLSPERDTIWKVARFEVGARYSPGCRAGCMEAAWRAAWRLHGGLHGGCMAALHGGCMAALHGGCMASAWQRVHSHAAAERASPGPNLACIPPAPPRTTFPAPAPPPRSQLPYFCAMCPAASSDEHADSLVRVALRLLAAARTVRGPACRAVCLAPAHLGGSRRGCGQQLLATRWFDQQWQAPLGASTGCTRGGAHTSRSCSPLAS
jgi:hypothetical protein